MLKATVIEELGRIAKENGIVFITATQLQRPNRRWVEPRESTEI